MALKQHKLAAIYSLWDGEELLQGSIEQVLPFVDKVIAITQECSYSGNKYTGGEDEAQLLKRVGLIHEVHKLSYCKGTPMDIEIRKRNLGLRVARELKCTHFIFIDCDEYYDPAQFAAAKQEIIKEGYGATACRLYTYFKQPEYRLTPMEEYYVPFICQLENYTRAGTHPFPVYADPTRRVNTHQPFRKFEPDELVMHHYSWVRNDIERKLKNSSAAKNIPDIEGIAEKFSIYQLGDPIPFFGKRHSIEVVPDFFNIGWALRSTS